MFLTTFLFEMFLEKSLIKNPFDNDYMKHLFRKTLLILSFMLKTFFIITPKRTLNIFSKKNSKFQKF